MVEEGFEPHPWLRNPHVQTLLARAVRARAEPRYARTRIDTPDGDFLDLDVWEGAERPAAACLLLHGL
ncbi:MAG: hydrolase, partial [Gemmatimonadota bacterium]|nr:hydrolase [Gemmatimonadota bacterium]